METDLLPILAQIRPGPVTDETTAKDALRLLELRRMMIERASEAQQGRGRLLRYRAEVAEIQSKIDAAPDMAVYHRQDYEGRLVILEARIARELEIIRQSWLELAVYRAMLIPEDAA